jgi:hypothetical protein
MKVLDLQCGHQHLFEGWFASEEDFQEQQQRAMIECPLCGDASISKRLSAPRLNLGAARNEPAPAAQEPPSNIVTEQALQAAWLTVARRILADTDDVGTGFAEEARKIHYGEVPQRGIRGRATPEQADALIEEGIGVLQLALPDALKERLQ